MNRRLPHFILLLCVALFALSLLHLFKLRYAVGDVYPEYSSLRSDPLGTMGLYESLESLQGLSVRRDFNAQNQLPDEHHATYLHLAASRWDWTSLPAEVAVQIDEFLARGGRLVITFFPEGGQVSRPFSKGPPPTSRKGRSMRADTLKERWGIEFGTVPLELGKVGAYKPARVLNQSGLPLAPALDWHSAMVFTNLDDEWQTVYARGSNAVVIQRQFGPGSVVLASDTYFLSNEALQKQAQPELLAWLIGPAKLIVFDEAHLGITDTPGVAALMTKYHLQALGAGLLLLAGLFIWKSSISFVPLYPAPPQQAQVLGKNAVAGFINLLRRNIPRREVLRVCFEEWTKSLLQGRAQSIARVDQAQAILETENARAQKEKDPVRAYREICGVLKGAKRKQ